MNVPTIPAWASDVAEATLTDTCTITRQGEATFDPTTGPSNGADIVVYAGRCSILQPGGVTRRTDTGADDRSMSIRIVLLPEGTDGIQPGDIFTAPGHDDYPVKKILDRTHEVLSRIEVIDDTDAGQVPS